MDSIAAQRLISRRQSYQTSHLLHLVIFLCLLVFTGVFSAVWIAVWILCAVSNGIERWRIDRKLNGLAE